MSLSNMSAQCQILESWSTGPSDTKCRWMSSNWSHSQRLMAFAVLRLDMGTQGLKLISKSGKRFPSTI